MIGNWILAIKQWWKQLWCIHDYKEIETLNFNFRQCTKCGRIEK